jgi:hypothetical protein
LIGLFGSYVDDICIVFISGIDEDDEEPAAAEKAPIAADDLPPLEGAEEDAGRMEEVD